MFLLNESFNLSLSVFETRTFHSVTFRLVIKIICFYKSELVKKVHKGTGNVEKLTRGDGHYEQRGPLLPPACAKKYGCVHLGTAGNKIERLTWRH